MAETGWNESWGAQRRCRDYRPNFTVSLARPQMMSIIPNNVSGFVEVEKVSLVFVRNELLPLQKRFTEFNEWTGEANL